MRDGVIDQRLDDVLDFIRIVRLDSVIDFFQIFEDALVLLVDDVNAGFEFSSPSDDKAHGSIPLV
ncbi:hypothetical protein D3C78_1490460 [compost metagenome]